MSAIAWFFFGLAVTAGPPLVAVLLDEWEWRNLRRRQRQQERDAVPFEGNATQVFHSSVEPSP